MCSRYDNHMLLTRDFMVFSFLKSDISVKTIEKEIEKVVKHVLHAVYNEISAWITRFTGYKLPDLPRDFPNFSKVLFPFDMLESIGVTVPKAPDFEQLAKLPAKAFGR